MKNKKVLFVLLLICILGIVGATFAYFSSTDTFQNIFGTKIYKMEVVEKFASPDDWTPGTTTPNTVVATNKGDVDAAVRVSFVEEWKDASNNPLPLTDGDDNHAAIINYSDSLNRKWISSVENGTRYYYYKYKIGSNKSTSTFIDSVTFNPALEIDTENNCVTNSETHQQICTTETSGYAGGTYTLTITVETIQYDQYRNAWNTNVNILSDLPYTLVSGNLNTTGSVVKIADEEFYVIGQEDSEHVKLFAKYNLNVGNNIQTGTEGLQNSLAIGYNGDDSTKVNNYFPASVAFSSTNYWDGTPSYPAYVYTNNKVSNVYQNILAEYVDNYVDYLNTQGVYVSGKLMGQSDLIDLGCNDTLFYCDAAHGGSAPEWVYSTSYWLGSANSYDYVGVVHSFGDFSSQHYDADNEYGVRPIIILEK